jgi:hypothetical protein
MWVKPKPQPDGTYEAKSLPSSESVSGYELTQGMGCSAAFFGVLVFLLVTGPLEPIPWWRSAVVMAGGAGIIGAVVFGMRYPGERLESNLQTGRWILSTAWGAANYVALGLAVALVFLAAIEMRSSLARRRDRQKLVDQAVSGRKSTESNAAADSGRDPGLS